MKKVSIIIPLYNADQWIAATLESALAQTWKNKEVIVVDDGSKDTSLAIAKKFESASVKIISQTNAGAGVARNTALKEVQGDYIQYLDADDLLSPDKIESQIRVLEQNPSRMLAISRTVYFYDHKDIDEGKPQIGKEFVDADNPLDWLIELLGPEEGSMVQTGAWLTPREVADTAGLWDEHPSPNDDGEYFARVVLASTGIRRVDRGFCYYRKYRTGESLSGARSAILQWGSLRSLDLIANHILTKTNSSRGKRALARCYMALAVTAYPLYPEVSDEAARRVEGLGGIDYVPPFFGWKGNLLVKLFGWRTARRIGVNGRRLFSPLKLKRP